MDIVSASTVVGILASLATQAVKREKAGSLENILLSIGAAVGGSSLVGTIGMTGVDPTAVAVSSFAFHGLLGSQKPMQAIKFAGIDKVLEGIGKAVSTMSSRSNGA